MSSFVPDPNPRVVDVVTDEDHLHVDLADGRRITVPLAWFPRLLHANQDQRKRRQIMGDGEGIHWPDTDEDVSVTGLLRGARAPGASET